MTMLIIMITLRMFVRFVLDDWEPGQGAWETDGVSRQSPCTGHGDQAEHVGEDQLLVDGEMEPRVVGQDVRAACALAFSGQEEGEDADDRGKTGDVVGRLSHSVCNVVCSSYHCSVLSSPLLRIPESASWCCLPARLERTPRVFLC